MTASKRPERNPLIPARAVDPQQPLPDLEERVLQRWRERDVFGESLRARAGAPAWIFYEGPPTANGPPGAHHVLSRVFKDIYPRFKTMRGYLVERKGGWDCHGLPVEIAVEQELGITSKSEIEEKIGIENFNAKCRESVFAYVEEWDRLTERIGFWLDLEDAYRTLDESYIESVWWALAELHRKGLLYEAYKVVPYCTRCATALSSHEVALGYEDTVDPSIYVRLKVKLPAADVADERSSEATRREGYPLRAGDSLLIWTTTPWTLPGNVAVAVAPDATYVRASVATADGNAEVLVLAEARVDAVLGEHAEVLQRFSGRELVGANYEAPIFTLTDREAWEAPVLAGSFVTTDDGTGIVHVAPAFGEDDFNVAAASPEVPFDPTRSQTPYNPVRPDGTYDHRVRSIDGRRSYECRFVKDPRLAQELIEDLRANGALFKAESYEHSYPHCWRCGTPLIYYAKASWYVRTTKLREQLLDANETVNWHPDHVKHGRFGEWLKGNVDWALSRERYWGTPLPIWRCPEGHIQVIGAFSELEMLSGRTLADHHRPFVDDVELACPECTRRSAVMRRVPEVIDVWFDSGAMPFAQHHAPFEREAHFRARFPADFICEALDQTRGWFYSLLAISTLLFARAPYRNVVCLGLILDSDGQKMSKSKGNAVEPWDVIDAYGADAFRWYLFTSKAPWDGYRFSTQAIGETVRLFLKPLWSTYYFYVLYAFANAAALSDAGEEPQRSADDLDRWALSCTAATAGVVAERLDSYDATSAGRAIAQLMDDLSNWYVRRSRRRFWDGDPAAFATLRTCLLTLAKLLAPFCPFIADEIYDNLDGALGSVHLCDFPAGAELPARDRDLEHAMATARQTVRLGLGARAKAKIRIRQPLAEAVVVATGAERAAIERLVDVVRDELNVKRVRFVHAAEELARYEVKPNYQRLGPLFGKDMPLLAEAIAALDPARVAAAMQDGSEIGVAVAGRDHTLSPQDVQLTMQAPEGFAIEREGTHAVALELSIDEGLRREGRSRDIVHAVQNARRNAGLAVEDRIELSLDGDPELLDAAKAHGEYLAGETLAVALYLDGQNPPGTAMEHREEANIDGLSLGIALRRVASAPAARE
jgi:isoleucyl-tRNA synthetase